MGRIIRLALATALLVATQTAAQADVAITEHPGTAYGMGFRVRFSTSVSTLCWVRYGTTSSLGSGRNQSPVARRTSHDVLIPNLTSRTRYYYQIECDDEGRIVRGPLRTAITRLMRVTTTFQDVAMWSDGDDWSGGDAIRMQFASSLEGTTRSHWWPDLRSPGRDLDDDAGCDPGCDITRSSIAVDTDLPVHLTDYVDALPARVETRMRVQEDDTEWFDSSDWTVAVDSVVFEPAAYTAGWFRWERLCPHDDSAGRLHFCVEVRVAVDHVY